MLNTTLIQQVSEKKHLLDNARPLPKGLLNEIRADFLIKNTYHSNAIEGNTLTLYETRVILENGITIGGKTLREHNEAVGTKEATEYMEQLVNISVPLTQREIRNIHSSVMHKVDASIAGKYRMRDVIISGAERVPPSFYHLQDEMARLMKWYDEEARTLHPIVRASQLHAHFVNIHPFLDGNGRTARLLLNFELMKSKYPPVMIKVTDRETYYQTLDVAALTHDYSSFTNFVAQQCNETLDMYLSYIERAEATTE